ncbi:hypothetical protein CEXT_379521 [Caerostris extrusa]|uniref:Uncharacterized protein n=1 Tax=Caerostris extrusa TaxID=172846 RepID=A0AAV4PS93_CAEEX|nr:hypothetical protein CEXT_379521 [Caerostris extrusa]
MTARGNGRFLSVSFSRLIRVEVEVLPFFSLFLVCSQSDRVLHSVIVLIEFCRIVDEHPFSEVLNPDAVLSQGNGVIYTSFRIICVGL